MFNLLFGGAAGDGVETTAGSFEKILLRKGFYLYSMRDFMSRVRGGHNFAKIRFAATPVAAHRDALDGLVCMNAESFALHKDELKEKGVVVCDTSLGIEDARVVKLDINGLAKESGNPKTIGTVCIGALLKLFGLGIDMAGDVLRESLKPAIVEANLKALQLGYDAVDGRFTIQPGSARGDILLTGADAMAMGAIAGGVRFYSAYPMSPATTLLDFLTRHRQAFGIATEQAEDEIAAINMALGAAYAGARAMVGTSGGGFALMVEALGFAGIAELPVVMADIMRPGPATGLPTRTEQSDLNFVCTASQGEFPRMVIAVRSHADAFYQTARALRIAEAYQMPVILLGDQYLVDSAATIPMLEAARAAAEGEPAFVMPPADEAPEDYLRYRLAQDGISPLRIPGKSAAVVRVDSDEHDERGVITESATVRSQMVEKRAAKLAALRRELMEPEYHGADAPQTLAVCFGSLRNAAFEAVDILNQDGGQTGCLAFGDVWPLPTKELEKYAAAAKRVVNVEQNATGQLARLIRQETGIAPAASVLKYDGRQLSVDEIVAGLQRAQTQEGGAK